MNEQDPIVRNEIASTKRNYRFVFCVGMRRGGSTLQTQMVAAILQVNQTHLTTPSSVDQLIARGDGTVEFPQVVKAHKFLPSVAQLSAENEARIVYVYRDIRDVVASIITKYDMPPFSFVHGGLASLLQEYQQWSSVPRIHVARYENMIHDIAAEAIRLARFLNVEISTERANEIAEQFGVDRQRESIRKATNETSVGEGANRFDATTLLHHDHIQFGGSGAYRKVLSPRLIAALEWQLRGWMKQLNYKPDYSPLTQWLAHTSFMLKGLAHRAKVAVWGGRKSDPAEHNPTDGC